MDHSPIFKPKTLVLFLNLKLALAGCSPWGHRELDMTEQLSTQHSMVTFTVLSGSVVSGSANPWTTARQAPLSMESSRQEYWSGLPFSSPGDLPDPGIEPGSPAL